MIERIVVLPDVHLTTKVPNEYKLVKKFIKDYKPDEVIILGDFMEVGSLSSYDLCKKRKIEGKRYEQEIVVANKELDWLVDHVKKVSYLEGNHENRVIRYLESYPELKGILELPKKLKLNEKSISWHPLNTIIKRGKLYLTHGVYYGKYFAKKTVDDYGCSIIVGHTHRFQVHTIYPKMQKYPQICYGLGCLGDTDPSYKKNCPTGHLNQFATVEIGHKGYFNVYPINIINNSFRYGGKEWQLK